jgi:hypothetical protein
MASESVSPAFSKPLQYGGEAVSQFPWKDQAFPTFLDQNPPFGLRPEMGFRARQSPSGFNFRRRSTEPSEFSSLPIGRIAERIAQAIGKSPQLGGRPPTLRVGYINEFLF